MGETLYDQHDRFRRWVGDCLDVAGWGPVETPYRVVHESSVAALRCYGNSRVSGPIVLIIPAPIKGPYIWDLYPSVSVVRRCLRSGLRAYLIEWKKPGEREASFGFEQYADRLILEGLDHIRSQTGQRAVFLASHSLGGTLAALFSGLHPDRVRGLVLLGAPLHFGPGVGVFGPWVAAAPKAQTVTQQLGNVPGSFLDVVCIAAAPLTFEGSRWADEILSFSDPEALRTHLLVERWVLDETPLPKRLFEDIVEFLYREDRFQRGTLRINETSTAPERVTAPLLSVADARCNLAPPEAIIPFHEAAASRDKRLLWYSGDVGVCLQHVGYLVGRAAHREIWPDVIGWIRCHSETR